jgi:hypothetical protein
MKFLYALPFLMLFGCAQSIPPKQAPPAMVGSSSTGCHIIQNNINTTMISCRFHNQTNQDISTCTQVSFVSNIEHQVEYRSQPMCSGILAPNETSENADLIGGTVRAHLSKACGRDLQHCSLQIEP